MYDTYLYHHGVKGQKWGVRRYQNPDGSLTAQGRKQYGSGEAKRKDLSDRQKKALKVGATVVAGCLVAYGSYKLASNPQVRSYVTNGIKAISKNSSVKQAIKNSSSEITKKSTVQSVKKIPEKTVSNAAEKTKSIAKEVKQLPNKVANSVQEVKQLPDKVVTSAKESAKEAVKEVVSSSVKEKIPEAPKKAVNLVFGEENTFSDSDMQKMISNFATLSNQNGKSQSVIRDEGRDYAEELLRRNNARLGI